LIPLKTNWFIGKSKIENILQRYNKVIISKARARSAFIIRTAVRYVAKRYALRAYPPFPRVQQQRCYSHGRDTQPSFAVHEVRRVISTAQAQFLLVLCHSQGYYSYGKGTVPLPCATRTDVIRTAKCYFAPCRVQSLESYRHGTGPFSTCLVPTVWVLFVRAPCTTRTDVIHTARCYFGLCLAVFWPQLVCAGCLPTYRIRGSLSKGWTLPDLPKHATFHPVNSRPAQTSGVKKRISFSLCIRHEVTPSLQSHLAATQCIILTSHYLHKLVKKNRKFRTILCVFNLQVCDSNADLENKNRITLYAGPKWVLYRTSTTNR